VTEEYGLSLTLMHPQRGGRWEGNHRLARDALVLNSTSAQGFMLEVLFLVCKVQMIITILQKRESACG
jgi:hypothetical protein